MAHPIDKLPAIHPGSFLKEELEALGTSARKFSEHIHVPHNAVTGIMNGERSISAQMAIRLGQAFGTTPQYLAEPAVNIRSEAGPGRDAGRGPAD